MRLIRYSHFADWTRRICDLFHGSFFKKYLVIPDFVCLLLMFQFICTIQSITYIMKKHIWCAWDSNPGRWMVQTNPLTYPSNLWKGLISNFSSTHIPWLTPPSPGSVTERLYTYLLQRYTDEDLINFPTALLFCFIFVWANKRSFIWGGCVTEKWAVTKSNVWFKNWEKKCENHWDRSQWCLSVWI